VRGEKEKWDGPTRAPENKVAGQRSVVLEITR
jgi:hypothetical protein